MKTLLLAMFCALQGCSNEPLYDYKTGLGIKVQAPSVLHWQREAESQLTGVLK